MQPTILDYVIFLLPRIQNGIRVTQQVAAVAMLLNEINLASKQWIAAINIKILFFAESPVLQYVTYCKYDLGFMKLLQKPHSL